jgi:hypothetical protein
MEICVATCLPNFASFLNYNHRFKRRIYLEDKNVRINRLLGEHLRASRPKVSNFWKWTQKKPITKHRQWLPCSLFVSVFTFHIHDWSLSRRNVDSLFKKVS